MPLETNHIAIFQGLGTRNCSLFNLDTCCTLTNTQAYKPTIPSL